VSWSRLLLPLAAASLAALGGAAQASPSARDRTAPVRRVELTAHYSHWSLGGLTVRAGTVVDFLAHNADPIDHELIVGDQAVQDRHERGTEARHPPRPGEVSIPAGTTAETAIELSVPGTYIFACHLPGHYAYGMHGTITVVP
jgi:uncharacterized cupredoxin-like copper-binding protein